MIKVKEVTPVVKCDPYATPVIEKALSQVINEFLETIKEEDFIDIKYTSCVSNQFISDSALIIYRA